jgi:nucleoside-diphosphate-sugar epimerase
MSTPQPLPKVLITGASGYLGRFAIERLRSMFELTLFDRVAPRADHADLPFILGDVTDAQAVRRACRGQHAVVHMVSLVRERGDKPPSLFADVIVKGTWHVAQACVEEGVSRLVNISTSVITWPKLDPTTFMLAPEDEPRAPIPVGGTTHYIRPDLHYKLAKVLAEEVCDAYHDAHGLSVIHLRPGAIAGDGANAGPGSVDEAKWSAGRFFYIDPRDLAQAIEAALTSEVNHGRYTIVAGRRDSLFEWESAAREIGYAPAHNWPEIPEQAVK